MLHGRTHELHAVRSVLDAARERRSAALVIRGGPGSGKSALLGEARASAGDMTLLASGGIEAESELPFAGVHQLVRPALGLIDRLPAPQAQALAGAFGLSAGPPPDRFLISVAVLSLLAEASEEAPLLCLVDDAQWLDRESADALRFAARRLGAEGIALLSAVRDADGAGSPLEGLPELRVGPLGRDDALALVSDGREVAPAVASRLVEAGHGSPLALTELVASLAPDELAGRAPLPVPLPVGPTLERLYDERLRALPERVRAALLVAAAEDEGSTAATVAACRRLGIPEEALEAAEAAGLVDVGDRVAFRHPLVRSSVYGGAAFAARRRAHEALAEVLVDETQADRRAWHRAAAAQGPDEDVASALERSAERARSRSGYAAAAQALERAAELSVDDAAQARRLAQAAEAALVSGQGGLADRLVDRARGLDPDPATRARLDLARATLENERGTPARALAILVEGARAVSRTDPSRAMPLVIAAAQAGSIGNRTAEAFAFGREMAAALPIGDDPVDRFFRVFLTGVGAFTDGDYERSSTLLDEALVHGEAFAGPREQLWAAAAAIYNGDVARARSVYERTLAAARASGAIGVLPVVLVLVAGTSLWEHHVDAAEAAAEEGLRLAEETGQENAAVSHHAALARIAAERGREAPCRAHVEAALRGAVPRELGFAIDNATLASASLALGLGRTEEALHHLEHLARGDAAPWVRLISTPDLVEAGVRVGRTGLAVERLDDVDAWARACRSRWARPLVARARGILAADAIAEQHFERALALHAEHPVAYDRARTQLAFGEWLRRARRRTDARVQLRPAVDTFAGLGATPWEERARAELRATGETVARRDSASALTQLTPQERQVARIVAAGASNRDVAAQLFLSPRTVEYHLRKVFAKLGISSRGELGLRLGAGADARDGAVSALAE